MVKTESDSILKVGLVDDHAVVRAGLRALIDHQSDMFVCGEAATGSEARLLVEHEDPDILLLDLDLGDENGVEMIGSLAAISGKLRIIVLTALRDPAILHQAIASGAVGLINKQEQPTTLIEAIHRVCNGGTWLDPSIIAALVREVSGTKKRRDDPESIKIASLSKRELEVVRLVGEGLKSRDIASRLFISEITVRHHLTSIFSKLEVSDRVELMLYAYRYGLASLPFGTPQASPAPH